MVTHSTQPKCCSRFGVFALVLAVASLALSGLAFYKISKSEFSEKEFSVKMEKGINDFIASQGDEEFSAKMDKEISDYLAGLGDKETAAKMEKGISAYISELGEKSFSAKVEKGIDAYIAKKQAEQDKAAAAAAAAAAEPVKVSLGKAAFKGSKNAPVTILEFSDFQCPYCSRFALGAQPQIISEYVDKGKVKLAFRHFPLDFHPNAKPAALATECAREQGGDAMFFKFHDKIFADQQSLNVDNLKKWAGELGLKTAKFNDCLDTKKYEAQVDADLKDGQAFGVKGTPAFFVNGRFISGAQPFEAFKTVIDEELKKLGK